MTSLPLDRRLGLATTPVLAVGVFVPVLAHVLGGSTAAAVAMWAVGIAVAVVVVAEVALTVLKIEQPLSRMLLAMLIRGGLAVAAIAAAIQLGEYEPKTVVLIAGPLYGSLIIGEALSAVAAAPTTAIAAKTQPAAERG